MATEAFLFNPRQVMQALDFEIFRYRDRDLDVSLHHHDFYEIYMFLAGNVKYTIDSRSYRLMPGDVLLLSPQELHQPILESTTSYYERYVLWINSAYLNHISTPLTDLTQCFDVTSPRHTSLLRPTGEEQQRIAQMMQRLVDESSLTTYGSDIMRNRHLAHMMVHLNRLSMTGAGVVELPQTLDPQVESILLYINAHIGEELTLDNLAETFYMNKSTLARNFKRVVGASCYHYIVQKRLLISRNLLARGMCTTEAAQYCGFQDYSSYFRAFRAQYGLSPKQFQKNAQL